MTNAPRTKHTDLPEPKAVPCPIRPAAVAAFKAAILAGKSQQEAVKAARDA